MHRVLFSLAFIAGAFAACPHNNGTDAHLHFFNGDSSLPLQLEALTMTDNDGNAVWPWNPEHPVVFHVRAKYDGPDVAKFTLNADIDQWTDMSGSCAWRRMMLIPFIQYVDGCQYTACPVKAGEINLDIPVDLTMYYWFVENAGNDMEYKIDVTVNDDNYKKIGSIFLEVVIKF